MVRARREPRTFQVIKSMVCVGREARMTPAAPLLHIRAASQRSGHSSNFRSPASAGQALRRSHVLVLVFYLHTALPPNHTVPVVSVTAFSPAALRAASSASRTARR